MFKGAMSPVAYTLDSENKLEKDRLFQVLLEISEGCF